VGNAFRAIYLSFADNNPKHASSSLMVGLAQAQPVERWTEGWLTVVVKALTFVPGIAIYPRRYQAIRPVVEKLYGVDLPDTDEDLKLWCAQHKFEGVASTTAIQELLITLGYDLGPCGADGKFGRKSRLALQRFEEDMGVPKEYQDGYPDKHTMKALQRAASSLRCELWD